MNCDPSALINEAKCFNCIPPGMQGAVQTMLTCEWANAEPGGICTDPVVIDWLTRLANDFQVMPSEDTILAICDFCEALRTYGLMDKMLVVNPIIPDNFLSMRYPLIYQPGNGYSPFVNHNFVAADLTALGLESDIFNTPYFDTGFIPENHWADTPSGGISIYESDEGLGAPEPWDCGVESLGGVEYFSMTACDTNVNFVDGYCWNILSRIVNPHLNTPAFYTMTRTSNVLLRMLYQSSAIPQTILVTNIANQAGAAIPGEPVFFMAINESGSAARYNGRVISFMAIHEGLTLEEAENLFWSVQTLRMDLGGGFV